MGVLVFGDGKVQEWVPAHVEGASMFVDRVRTIVGVRCDRDLLLRLTTRLECVRDLEDGISVSLDDEKTLVRVALRPIDGCSLSTSDAEQVRRALLDELPVHIAVDVTIAASRA